MRVVPVFEKKQRGCLYCEEMQLTRKNGCKRVGCPHDECPYTVLGKYETYEQFMASEDSKILVDGFFQTVATCYELENANVSASYMYKAACSHVNF